MAAGNAVGLSEYTDYKYGYLSEKEGEDAYDERGNLYEWLNIFEDEFADYDDEDYKDYEDYDDYEYYEDYLYTEKMYNTNNGSCELKGIDLDFYMDDIFIAAIPSGRYINLNFQQESITLL